jgi:hypothetical protein
MSVLDAPATRGEAIGKHRARAARRGIPGWVYVAIAAVTLALIAVGAKTLAGVVLIAGSAVVTAQAVARLNELRKEKK